MKKLISSILALVVTITSITIIPFESVNAAETTGGEYEIKYDASDRIIVSLGDSYSAGEGLGDYYDGNLPLSQKVISQDWLCHRSKNAWSGKLILKNLDGSTITMKDHRGNADTDGNWYFAAMSGAVTYDITNSSYKHYDKKDIWGTPYNNKKYEDNEYVPEEVRNISPQISIFDQIKNKKTDYVTMTLGGNDVKFVDVVIETAKNCDFLEYVPSNVVEKVPVVHNNLDEYLEYIKNDIMPDTIERLKEKYKVIAEKAGSQTHIIIAGYPKLISETNVNPVWNFYEASRINKCIVEFNDEIKALIGELSKNGMNISFVSVIDEFGDHGAYSILGEYINGLTMEITGLSQELENFPIISPKSFHPNKAGAKVYAECVQKEIKRVEENRTRIWGQVVDVSNKPISGVKVTLTDGDNKVHKTNTSDTNGNYGFELDYQEGRHYTVKFEAKDYKTLVVKEKKGGNRITINATLKKDSQEYTAEDLINKPVKEIVELMGETFDVDKYQSFFYNNDVFPGLEFYVDCWENDENKLKEAIIKNNPKLIGIQVNDSGAGFRYKDIVITANMDYSALSSVFEKMKCKRGTGALISGAWEGIAYTTETDNCKVTINFDVNWDVSKYLSEDIEIPVSEMKEHNPKIKNIVIVSKPESSATTTESQTTNKEWKQLYIDAVKNDRVVSDYVYYALVNVDNDGIPELVCQGGDVAHGTIIAWIKDGSVVNEPLGYSGFSYYPNENRFCASYVNHGIYRDTVYEFQNKTLVKLYEGEPISEDNSSSSVFDKKRSASVKYFNRDEIINIINNY